MLSKIKIEKYFTAEKNQSAAMMVLGIAAIGWAVFLLMEPQTDFHLGMGLPLLLTGGVITWQWYRVFTRCDIRCINSLYNFEMNTSGLEDEEIPEMKIAVKRFTYFRHAALTLLVTGIILFCSRFKILNTDFLSGMGAALSVMSSVAFGAALMAEIRARKYLKLLENYFSTK
jgi:hypothetical protein